MCLNPLTIKNPTKSYCVHGGEPAYITVQCNKCAECIRLNRQQWSFRSYHQANDCIKKGGFVYFDTLTYSDEHLPRISDYIDVERLGIDDFSVFDLDHFKLFLKNLRRQLHYHYNVNSKAFKYFLTSEYGLDDRYTHRPHYHILFYVYADINPFDFSRLVAKCWRYGRTDGLPYKRHLYVRDHIYRKSMNNDYATITKVCGYVSKYVSKDADYDSLLEPRKEQLKSIVNDEQAIKELFRPMDIFHRQSQGYGRAFLDNMTDDEYNDIVNYQVVTLRDSGKVRLALKLPPYYVRQLYMHLSRQSDGSYLYRYNDDDVTRAYLKTKTTSLHKHICNHLINSYANLTTEQKSFVDRLLGNHTLYDVSTYIAYYRYRVKPFAATNMVSFNNTIFDVSDQVENIVNSKFKYNDTNVAEVSPDSIIYPCDELLSDNTVNIPTKTFYNCCIYKSQNMPQYKNFDTIISLFDKINKIRNLVVQSAFEHTERLQKKYSYQKRKLQ